MKQLFLVLALSFTFVFASAEKRSQELIDKRARERAIAQLAEEKRKADEELTRSFSTIPLGRTSYTVRTFSDVDAINFEEQEQARRLQCIRENKNCKIK